MKWYKNHNVFLGFLFVLLLLNAALPSSIAYADPLNNFFYDSSNGTPSGYTISDWSATDYCKYTGVQYITSSVICQFVIILDSVLVQVFNTIQTQIKPVVQAALTLYIAMFGAQVMMGTAQMNARDILGRLFKIAVVWAFATESYYSVGVAFYFYMGVMADIGAAIINAVSSVATDSACGASYPTASTNSWGPNNAMPLFYFIDELLYCTFAGGASMMSTKILGFFLAMVTLYPPMFGVFTWWIVATITNVAKAVLTFLITLATIAFLISMAPIFLSLMLFEITKNYFENWLKYMIAYSVQVVLVFGIIVLWIIVSLHFVGFFTDLGNMIFPFDPGQYAGNYLNKTDTWAVCTGDFTATHPGCDHSCSGNPCVLDPQYLIPPTKVIDHTDLIYYIFKNLIGFLILSYAFGALLKNAEKIASGITQSQSLGSNIGGFGMNSFGSAGRKKKAGSGKHAEQGA